MERKKEFLVRMNIANFETKIPFLNHLRICSKHFKEEDFQYIICRSPHKTRRLLPNALPTDWRDVYPEEVELVRIIHIHSSCKIVMFAHKFIMFLE